MTNVIKTVEKDNMPDRRDVLIPTENFLDGSDIKKSVSFEITKRMEALKAAKGQMTEGVHFSTIPGCGNKPALLKTGAEFIAFIFRLCPVYDIERHEDERGVSFTVKTRLTRMSDGVQVSSGVGCCSSLESKYRHRSKFDQENTILKMAKKRSFVDAILGATGFSLFFTQDIEEYSDAQEPKRAPQGKMVKNNTKPNQYYFDDEYPELSQGNGSTNLKDALRSKKQNI